MKLRDLFSDDAAIEPQAEAVDVKGLSVDSRAVKPGDLFFALAGSKTDGSRFIEAAIASGAVAIACEQAPAGERRDSGLDCGVIAYEIAQFHGRPVDMPESRKLPTQHRRWPTRLITGLSWMLQE